MKALNIILGTMGLGLVMASGLCMIAGYLFPPHIAAPLVLPLALISAMSARPIVQKIFGYTLYEALSGNSEEKK
ncbi:MAG TPA: hypothetical protein DDY18_03310 [Flavobacterium sp.]|jgi:hypothetical protein|nr:hypothetical protein [Flavobacterium sp.]